MSTSHIGSGNWGLGREASVAAPAAAEATAAERAASARRAPGSWNIVVVLAVLGVLILGAALVIGGPEVGLVPAEPGAGTLPLEPQPVTP
jgi:hypothetical protein